MENEKNEWKTLVGIMENKIKVTLTIEAEGKPEDAEVMATAVQKAVQILQGEIRSIQKLSGEK